MSSVKKIEDDEDAYLHEVVSSLTFHLCCTIPVALFAGFVPGEYFI